MSVFDWPGWGASRFELRLLPNSRTYTGPYTPATQVIDLLGERMQGTLTITPTNNPVEAAAREAFFDRLKGQAHQIRLWHLKLTAPQGTLRDGQVASVVNGSLAVVTVVNGASAAVTVMAGVPAVRAAVALGSNTATITTLAGRTVRAGDPLSIAGQWVRVMADATADGAGSLAIEFQPRARSAWAVGAAVVWNRPTFNVMLKSDGVPTGWVPGFAEGISFDFIEVP